MDSATSSLPLSPVFSVGGQRLRLIVEGGERLAALIELIDGAQRDLRLFYYMFEPDSCGRLVRDRLVAAARRGVKVDLLIDSFGSSEARASFFRPILDAGGRFARFSSRWGYSYLIRNHQKMAIADGARALIGGFNIGAAYFAEQGEERWSDIGLSIAGSKVAELARRFDELAEWTRRDSPSLLGLRDIVRNWSDNEGPIDWLGGGPTERLSPWALTLKKDLESGERLDIASAYFSPGQSIVRRIGRLARRGRARLVLPGKTDNGATIGASRLLYGYLLRRGAELREYQPCRLHSKLIVIDDKIYVGSANLDIRSLFINLELMARIENAELADHGRALIDQMARRSQEITPEAHEARASLFNRMRWALSYFLVSTLDYTVNRRLNLGLRA